MGVNDLNLWLENFFFIGLPIGKVRIELVLILHVDIAGLVEKGIKELLNLRIFIDVIELFFNLTAFFIDVI